MDKTHYKELIEKYFEETITDVEIKELSDWIKNDRQLHDWWEQEFERTDSSMNPVLRDKLLPGSKKKLWARKCAPSVSSLGNGLLPFYYLSVSLSSLTIF